MALGLLLVILWILVAYTQVAHLQLQLDSKESLEDGSRDDVTNLSKHDFINAAISSAVEDGFDNSHISAMCNDQEWDDTVVFTCRGIIGGIGKETPTPITPLGNSRRIGNIRQELLHCIRYSISAGAGLILPVINLRSESNLSDLESGTAPMSYLFDQDRFISRLKTACPKMPIYRDKEELEKVGPVTETEPIYPKKLPHWPTQPAFEARTRVEQLRAPAGQISLIPFQRVWQYL